MTRIGIIAALPGELQPLVRNWQRLRLSDRQNGAAAWRSGMDGGAECIAVCAGMGQEAAARACGIAAGQGAQDGALDALVSLGWAGALSCGVSPGNAYPVAEVIQADTGERFRTSFPPGSPASYKLVTLNHVAGPTEKRELAENYRAVLVDMEAAAVGRLAQTEGIAFYCFKAVSDAPQEVLPDFSRYTDAGGQLKTASLLAHLALRPGYWPVMARMRKNTMTGAAAMAEAMNKFLDTFLHDGKHAKHSHT